MTAADATAFADRFLARLPPSAAAGLARDLAGTLPAEPPPPATLPACAHLDAAVTLGRSGPVSELAGIVARLAPRLRWTYSYPDAGRFAGLGRRIAFCEVLGLGAFAANPRVRLGLTLMAPGTAYPAHAHPAVETYLVIAGTALWQAGTAAPASRPPGAVIVHPSGIAHAMTTAAEPLLAAWSWTGDIRTAPRYLDRQGD